MTQHASRVCKFVSDAIEAWQASADRSSPGPVVFFILRSGARLHGRALGAPQGEVIELTQVRGSEVVTAANTIYVDPSEVAACSRTRFELE